MRAVQRFNVNFSHQCMVDTDGARQDGRAFLLSVHWQNSSAKPRPPSIRRQEARPLAAATPFHVSSRAIRRTQNNRNGHPLSAGR